MQSKWRPWAAFGGLGLIWGSSFLWIKIIVQEIGPLTLVGLRLLLGLLGLLLVLRLRRQPLRLDRSLAVRFLLLAVLNTALPFALISWGETRIDSALASILNGTVPLFTLVLAHFWLRDERITTAKAAGLLVGFGGVVVLVGRGFQAREALGGDAWGEAAVLAAALSYATAITFTRRHLRGQPPLLQSTMVVLISDALIWLAALQAERPITLPRLPITWIALAWLGLLGTCTAYLLYFYLINTWGSTRTSVVTYIFPAIGLALGITFLGERLDWRLVAGSALVLTGIVSVNVENFPALRRMTRALGFKAAEEASSGPP